MYRIFLQSSDQLRHFAHLPIRIAILSQNKMTHKRDIYQKLVFVSVVLFSCTRDQSTAISLRNVSNQTFSPAFLDMLSKQSSNLENCQTNKDCTSDRCLDMDNVLTNPCTTSANICLCMPKSFKVCTSHDDCTDGTECYDTPLTTGAKIGTCLNPANAERLSATRKCIDARALRHLETHELVFEKHSIAKVFCDEKQSCATPGHIVQYRGKGMMMKSYCAIVGCERRFMEVNSPRYSVGMRIQSNTDSLSYTALAATHETFAEEAALSTLVRLGL